MSPLSPKHALRLIKPNYCKNPMHVLDEPTEGMNDYDFCFHDVSDKTGIDWRILKAIALTENGGKINSNAVSADGQAIGLMQVRAGNLTGKNWLDLGYPNFAILADRYGHGIYNTQWWPYIKNILLNGCFNILVGALLYKNAVSIAHQNNGFGLTDYFAVYNQGSHFFSDPTANKLGQQYSIRAANYVKQVSLQSI